MNSSPRLVQLAQAGDPEAVLAFIQKNQAMVQRLALSVLDDSAEAGRVVQEAAALQVERLAAYPGAAAHSAWLYQLTLEICRRRLRQRHWGQRLPDFARRRLQIRSEQADLPPDTPLLYRLAAALDDAHRLPLVLRYAHDLPPQAIAQVLGWREGLVRRRIGEARRRLAQAWQAPLDLTLPAGPEDGLRHAHATRLSEAAADFAITDAESALLERHLKGCSRCQENARRLAALEKELRAVFQARWAEFPPLAENLAQTTLQQRRLQAARRKTFSLAGGVLVSLLVVGLILMLPQAFPSRVLLAPAPPTAEGPTLAPSPVPAATRPAAGRQDLIGRLYPGKIAFLTFSELSEHVFTYEPKNGAIQKITRGIGAYSAPVWSPDGRRIAYLMAASSGKSNQVYLANADGSGAQMISRIEFAHLTSQNLYLDPAYQDQFPQYGPVRWSPDGQNLLAGVWASAQEHFLTILPADGREARVLPVRGLNPQFVAWSPDGSSIAYLADSDRILYLWQLNRPLVAGVNPRPLNFDGSWDLVFGLAWNPDSRQIAVLGGLRELDVVQVNLLILDRSGREVTNNLVSIGVLTRTSRYTSQLTWSPDGRYLAMIPVFTDNDLSSGKVLLFRAGLKGTLPPLVTTSAVITAFSWSPDSNWLAYATGREIWAASLQDFEVDRDHLVRLSALPGEGLNWQKTN